MTALEIVADFQSLPSSEAIELVRRWADEDRMGLLIRRATFAVEGPLHGPPVVLPNRWSIVSAPPPRFWDATLEAAGEEGHAALLLLGGVHASVDAAGLLLGILEEDPMFGAAAARVQCERGCCVQTLGQFGAETGADPEWLPRRALQYLPVRELAGSSISPCMVMRPLLLTDFSTSDQPFGSLHATLLHRLGAARRCGFRTAVANRAVIRVAGSDCGQPPTALPPLTDGDATRLRPLLDDGARADLEFRGASNAVREQLLARHLAVVEHRARPSLLLDMRNVRATYNGTAFAAIGVAWGLYQSAEGWDVAILADPAGRAFHELDSAFPGWTVHTTLPPPGFTVALRLSQPWHIQELIDLHGVARLNLSLMLDTIAWDSVYVAPPHLDGTWDFLASSADGLLFISDFSRSRFRNRFPDARGLQEVCHLSFDPRDYIRPECLHAPAGEHILVVGNQLDHKDMAATVDLLSSAFPFIPIEALGGLGSRSSRVTTHESGNLAEAEVHRLYARARLVVFPSFYEGFGLPLVTALAYGRTLITRASPLVDEIAPHSPAGGRLITYSRRNELVDRVGRVLHGEALRQQQTGHGVKGGAPPRSWRDVGKDILQFIETLTAHASPEDWHRRDRTVRQIVAYCS